MNSNLCFFENENILFFAVVIVGCIRSVGDFQRRLRSYPDRLHL